MSRPRLLFLSHRVPWPPHNGAAIRTWNILGLLARDFEVAGLCYDRPDRHLAHVPMADRVAAMATRGRFEFVPIPQCRSRLRLAGDHVRSVLGRRPYTWYVHESREALSALARLLEAFRPDVVHVDSMDMVRLLPLLDLRRTVVTHHNVESQLLERRSEGERPLRGRYVRLQADRLRRAEAEWMPRVALNVVVSPEDEGVFRAIAPAARYAVLPNGVDVDYFRPAREVEVSGCVFVGGTTWHPNRDALHWFAGEILPRLRARGEQGPVTWVGRVTEEERRTFDGVNGLRLTGYVDDIRPHVASAGCFIAPIRFGGGTRLKLLDAWAMGKAIVSTRPGAEGLGGVDGESLLLADDPDAFAEGIVRVLNDAALRRRLEVAGRAAAESRFSWAVIGARMAELYRGVARGEAAAR